MIISYDPEATPTKQYPVAPEGMHDAVCVDVVDLGMKPQTFNGKTKEVPKVRLVWQIEDVDPETGWRLTVSQQYTASLWVDESGKRMSKLRETLKTWRGRDFTVEEAKHFEIETLVGINCQIQVIHAPGSNGKVYANVNAVLPVRKGVIALRPLDYTRVKDRPAKDNGNAAPRAAAPTDDDTPF